MTNGKGLRRRHINSGDSRLVRTVYDDQDELLAAMVGLHSDGVVDLDPTFGRGYFYRYALEAPRLKFDISPRRPGVVAADVRRLPLRDGAVAAAMFDPPFMDYPGRIKTAIMIKKYTYINGGPAALRKFYRDALGELFRVLGPGGVLYFKCQDLVSGRGNYFNHVYIHDDAVTVGFRPRDLFILLAKSRPIQYNLYKQVHARKFHCYFWVFTKPKRRLDEPPGPCYNFNVPPDTREGKVVEM